MMTTNGLANGSIGKRGETILLVEDHKEVRDVFRRVLELTGYRILEAVNGEDALLLCDRLDGAVDVLITDVIMPRMGGQELARRLGARYPAMKILYVSGYSEAEIESQGMLDATESFLSKPFSADILAKRVRALVEESRRHIA